MNKKIIRITTAISWILCGWILGFLRLPYVDVSKSFFVGLIAGLFLLSLAAFTLYMTRSKWPTRWLHSAYYPQGLIFLILICGLYVCLQLQGTHYNTFMDQKDTEIQHLKSRLKASTNRRDMIAIDELIDRFDPNWLDRDSISFVKWSNQLIELTHLLTKTHLSITDSLECDVAKGYLIEKIIQLPMDSISWIWLSGQCDLTHADLRKVNLSHAHFESCNLSFCDFRGANMQHIKIGNSSLRRSNMCGTDLSYSKIENTNLKGVDVSFADLSEAMISHSKMSWSSFRGSDLTNTVIVDSDLRGVDLYNTFLLGATLSNLSLKGAYVGSNWIHQLETSDVQGWKSIDSNYTIKEHDLTINNDAPYTIVTR